MLHWSLLKLAKLQKYINKDHLEIGEFVISAES